MLCCPVLAWSMSIKLGVLCGTSRRLRQQVSKVDFGRTACGQAVGSGAAAEAAGRSWEYGFSLSFLAFQGVVMLANGFRGTQRSSECKSTLSGVLTAVPT